MARAFDEEWRAWVRLNVGRGCSRDQLFRILSDEGFEHADIQRELNHTPSVSLSCIENPLRPAQTGASLPGRPIRIVNLKRADSSRIELYTAENFLDTLECHELVELIGRNLRPSTISSARDTDHAFRTSRTCDLSDREPAVDALNGKICSAMGIDGAYSEPTQGQHYDIQQEFKPHTDYFESYELERFSTPTLGQRSWTFMIYLNRPEGGGETVFPATGLAFRPVPGLAVIWNNLLPDGTPNPHTIHQGKLVTGGSKVIITKWFRQPRIQAN